MYDVVEELASALQVVVGIFKIFAFNSLVQCDGEKAWNSYDLVLQEDS